MRRRSRRAKRHNEGMSDPDDTTPPEPDDKPQLRRRSEAKPKDDTLIDAKEKADGPPIKRYDFPSANAAKKTDIRPDLAKIVETVWIGNMHDAWMAIRKSLQVGEKRSEHGFLTRALDEARTLSYDAHRLYVTAKKEFERWELENEVVNGAMWLKATRELQAEKDAKERNKTITDADVRAKCSTLYPDEYAAQEQKRRAVKLTVDSMAQLSKDANEHVEDLRVMLSKLRTS